MEREHEKSFYFDEKLKRKAPELYLANAVVDDFLSVWFLFLESFHYVVLMDRA